MMNWISIILSSAVIAAIISFSSAAKSNQLKYITSERTKWRKEIKTIASGLAECEVNNKKSRKLLTKLKLQINSYGYKDTYPCDIRLNCFTDEHIWKEIEAIEDGGVYEYHRDRLLRYLQLLLKFDWEESIKNKAGEIMADFKMRGKAALNRVSEFIGLKDKLVGIRNKVKEGIADTNRTIAKIDSFGKGMREAGQKVANTFRTFADKEEVDYSDKEKKFSKTEVAKKPWKWQKKVYESMVLHLDAAIDKVEDLSRDVELDRMDKKQIDKPEQVTDIRDAIAPISSVAEPTEYQFGAEAFEEAYPKMDSVIKQDAKAPSVPKTGKVR